MTVELSTERLDKWLWTVRVFRTRTAATEACRAGNVTMGEQTPKPSREVHIGETVLVRQGLVTRTLRVLGFPARRVGAKIVKSYCDELTPPEEFAKARVAPVQHFLAREKGSGRPTKRDRRALDRFFGE